ncbi:hypothetical protein [Paraliobacillus zengyii]|uniref:hypothetical protein n=1 Tax=Paraliobacillus zengyii TaxID=2213194 RepID=UPI000DD3912B|nr:hypothetical protein [Paraliobacillus zengyii]
MISNLEEKKFINKQIMHLENALADLKFKLLPDNPEIFKVMSISYVDKIQELRKEIDTFLGVNELKDIEKSDIVIRLKGPEIGYGRAPISVVSSILDETRKGFQNLYSYLNGFKNFRKVPQSILKACDMSLAGMFEGSLQVALQRPSEQISLFDEDSDFNKTVELYLQAASWASKNDSIELLKRNIPDDELREVALKSILRLIPKSTKKVNRVHLYGSLVNENIYLNKQSRDYIIENLAKKVEDEQILSFEGRVREVDLDKGSFKLREVKDENGIHEIIGHINESLMEDLKECLDDVIIVKGVIKSETQKSKTLEIRFIESASE